MRAKPSTNPKWMLGCLLAVLCLDAMPQQAAKDAVPTRILGAPMALPMPAQPMPAQPMPAQPMPAPLRTPAAVLAPQPLKAEPSSVGQNLPKQAKADRGLLTIVRGQRLSRQLKEWLAGMGMELIWAAHGAVPGHVRDVELLDDFESSSADLKTALSEILGPFGLVAEISSAGNRVTVLNADNSSPN